MADPPSEEIIRACLKRYDPSRRPGKFIQSGGTCVVYEIENAAQPDHQPVSPEVVKVMYTWCFSPDASDSDFNVAKRRQMYRYFTGEAGIMRELSGCAYTVPLIDSFVCMPDTSPFTPERAEQNGFRVLAFMIMPRLYSLLDYNREFPLSESGLIHMATDICTALRECHRRGILHRDVKPWNIFVSAKEHADRNEPMEYANGSFSNGSSEYANGYFANDSFESADGSAEDVRFLLGDFGLCRRNPFSGGYISRVGTEGFTTPSILAGKVPEPGCYNSDLSSLGVSIHYLLTGSPNPEDAPAFSRVSARFRQIIHKACRPDAKERYPDAGAMLLDLRKLSGGTRHEKTADSVIPDPDFIEAKRALLHRNYPEALALAGNGVKKGSADCRRLFAYCMYLERGRKDPYVCAGIIRKLEDLAYEGDGKARYLCAVIYINRMEWTTGIEILRCAAENDGVVSAQYDYGWYLCNGFCGVKKDPGKGLFLLKQAAKAGYPPALRRLKDMNLSPETDPEIYDLIHDFTDETDITGGRLSMREMEHQARADFL